MDRDYRRENLPPPSRKHPVPDAHAIAVAQSLEHTTKAMEALEVRVRTASVPENDRVWQRHRNEKDTLDRLLQCDLRLVEAALLVAARWGGLDAKNAEHTLDGADFGEMADTLGERERILSILR